MHDYKGKIAVIIGAANGLGKGMAMRFAANGAKLSLADIDAENLAKVEQELKAKGAEVIASCFDARNYDAVVAFARQTFSTYGAVDYFVNNAGISSIGNIWNAPLQEWRDLFDFDVMSLVHGIKAFIPDMIAQDKECYFVNTASNAGLQCTGILPSYTMSKHAAVSVTESLAIQLQISKTKIKASVFCPGLVVTELYQNSIKLRTDDPYYSTKEYLRYDAAFKQGIETGMPLDEAMDRFFEGLEADKFYIRTHENEEKFVQYRVDRVLDGARPIPMTKQ